MTLPGLERASEVDRDIADVADVLRALDPDGSRMANAFRATFDQLYDGQHTGRYKVDQLFKTEKTHFGTLIEINLQREFSYEDGAVLDYKIAGHEVDCKYSHTGAWMLPQESFEQIILVTKADDSKAVWSAGLVRVTQSNRRDGVNQDKKTGLNVAGRENIHWLHRDAAMPPNALLQLAPSAVEDILARRSGQARLNELFRRASNRRLTRNIIATVAQQDDYMKRVRANGGSRSALRPEGFLILSGDYIFQRSLAVSLGAAVPERGEMVSVQLVPATPGASKAVLIGEGWWRLAVVGDVVSRPAPEIDRTQ